MDEKVKEQILAIRDTGLTKAKDLTSARGAGKRSRKRASYKSPERSQT